MFEEVREELALDLSVNHLPRVRREGKSTHIPAYQYAGMWADLRVKEHGNSLLPASLLLVK